MRISYLSEAIIPSRTANSIQVMKMCEALSQEGHHVELLAPGQASRSSETTGSLWHHYGVQPLFAIKWIRTRVPEPFGKYVYGIMAAAHARFRSGSDLVYSRQLPGALVAAALGCRVILEVHDAPSSYGRLGFAAFEALLRQRRAERVVVISNALKEFLVAAWPNLVHPEDVVVAPDGVDLERFQQLPGPGEARARIGLAQGFVAGHAGHLYPGRGVEVIIELARRSPEAHFLLMGGNPADVVAGRELARQAELTNVTFTGFIANAELPLFLAACDVLLMPFQRRVAIAGGGGDTSRWMSPMKMFEYLATGRPILASDLPVLREVLDEDNAILLDPTDVDAWQVALQRVRRDRELRNRLGERARNDAAKYTWRQRACTALPQPGVPGSDRTRLAI